MNAEERDELIRDTAEKVSAMYSDFLPSCDDPPRPEGRVHRCFGCYDELHGNGRPGLIRRFKQVLAVLSGGVVLALAGVAGKGGAEFIGVLVAGALRVLGG